MEKREILFYFWCFVSIAQFIILCHEFFLSSRIKIGAKSIQPFKVWPKKKHISVKQLRQGPNFDFDSFYHKTIIFIMNCHYFNLNFNISILPQLATLVELLPVKKIVEIIGNISDDLSWRPTKKILKPRLGGWVVGSQKKSSFYYFFNSWSIKIIAKIYIFWPQKMRIRKYRMKINCY